MRQTRNDSGWWIGKAVGGGLLGGALMGVWMMALAWVTGFGFWTPLRAIAAMFFGLGYLGTGFAWGPVLVGVGTHLILAMVFGLIYAVAVAFLGSRVRLPSQVGLGVLWGLLLWFINTFGIGHLMPGGQLMTGAMPVWVWFVAHLVYGVTLGLAYAGWRQGRASLELG